MLLIAMQLQFERPGFILAFIILVAYWLIASVGVWRSAGVSMASDNWASKLEATAARGLVALVAAYALWNLYDGGALWLTQRVTGMTRPEAILLAGPDRERQVRAGAGSGRENRRRHRQCGFHAGLSRPARDHRAPDGGGRSAGSRTCSTAMWMRRRIIPSAAGCAMRRPRSKTCKAAGQVPIIVGGTGLYFMTLTRGLAAVPPIPPDIRAQVRGRLESEGVAPLYAELLERDPVTAHRLMPGDRSRISRALEVVLATGRSLSDWHRDGMPAVVDPAHAAQFFLDVDRDGTGPADRCALRRHAREAARWRKWRNSPRAGLIRCCRR